MTRRAIGSVLAVAVLMVGVTACGDDDEASMPVAAEGEFGRGGFPVEGGGRLDVTEPGCWTVDGVMAAWAPGSSIDEADRTVATPDGAAVADGSFVRITGRELRADEWPGAPDGRWAEHAEACGFGPWVMVFVETMEIDPFDPTVMSEGELAAMVADATLTSAGGCGYQFTAANADGTVGLIVSDSSWSETAATGELPDDRFEVTVRVGSRLFDQWCTDVLFPFADPFTAARSPVTAGRFEFDISDDLDARFVLDDAVVDSPTGEIALGRVTMTNSCYSCIPG